MTPILWLIILVIALFALFIGGLMLMAKRADKEIELIEPGDFKDSICDAGDGVSNAGDANSEMQAGTGETSVAADAALKSESSTVVNAPLPQSSPCASIAQIRREMMDKINNVRIEEWPKYFSIGGRGGVMVAESSDDLGTFAAEGTLYTAKSRCGGSAVSYAASQGYKQISRAEASQILGRPL